MQSKIHNSTQGATEIDEHLRLVASEEFISHAAARLQQSPARVQELVATYTNEARYGYNLIRPYLEDGMRILEVGAGIGVLSTFLHINGHKIIAIEPSGIGFDLNNAIGKCLVEWLNLTDFALQDVRVEELDRGRIGEFDLIFSVNVVEHLPDLDAAFQRMGTVLASNGRMIHTCPNYHVPYEPHFAIPLLPFVPSATRWVLKKEITRSGLWRSFNFVTSSGVKRVTRRQRLDVEFEPETMYRSLLRLGNDPVFAERHKGFISRIYRFLNFTRLIHILRHWPTQLSTPMNFVCQHKRSP